jgi:hypothetical protein
MSASSALSSLPNKNNNKEQEDPPSSPPLLPPIPRKSPPAALPTSKRKASPVASVASVALSPIVKKKKKKTSHKSHTNMPLQRSFAGTARDFAGSTKSSPSDKRVRGPALRRAKGFVTSHNQLASLIEKGLPRPHNRTFFDSFHKISRESEGWAPMGIERDELVGKTPLDWIESALKDTFLQDSSFIRKVTNPKRINDLACRRPPPDLVDGQKELDLQSFYLIEVILDRMKERSRRKTGDPAIDATTVLPVLAYKKKYLASEYDWMFRSFILVMPDAGILYCARDKDIHGNYNQLSLSILRLNRNSGELGKGGYCREFLSAWRISMEVTVAEGQLRVPPKVTFPMLQVSDHRLPPLPLDWYDQPTKSATKRSKTALRLKYLDELSVAPSTKIGCRHFVREAYHRDLSPFMDEMLVLNPSTAKSIDLYVGVHGSVVESTTRVGDGIPETIEEMERVVVQEQSTVNIRYANRPRQARVSVFSITGHVEQNDMDSHPLHDVTPSNKSTELFLGEFREGSNHNFQTSVIHSSGVSLCRVRESGAEV